MLTILLKESYLQLKSNLTVFLAGVTVAMANYCPAKIITCSPMIG